MGFNYIKGNKKLCNDESKPIEGAVNARAYNLLSSQRERESIDCRSRKRARIYTCVARCCVPSFLSSTAPSTLAPSLQDQILIQLSTDATHSCSPLLLHNQTPKTVRNAMKLDRLNFCRTSTFRFDRYSDGASDRYKSKD